MTKCSFVVDATCILTGLSPHARTHARTHANAHGTHKHTHNTRTHHPHAYRNQKSVTQTCTRDSRTILLSLNWPENRVFQFCRSKQRINCWCCWAGSTITMQLPTHLIAMARLGHATVQAGVVQRGRDIQLWKHTGTWCGDGPWVRPVTNYTMRLLTSQNREPGSTST